MVQALKKIKVPYERSKIPDIHLKQWKTFVLLMNLRKKQALVSNDGYTIEHGIAVLLSELTAMLDAKKILRVCLEEKFGCDTGSSALDVRRWEEEHRRGEPY